LLTAAEQLFSERDATTRRRAYADEMARVYAGHGDDPDVASWYALALLGTMSRSLIGYDAHEGHGEGLAGSDTQRHVAEILTRVLASHPQHPGALHYLIHDYDDPAHARLALDAARTLARAAPPSSHARHMPAHIFLQLGMWRDAAAADRGAFDISHGTNFHALSWLQYELLQRGRYADASAAIGAIEPEAKRTGSVELLSDLASMRARFVVETRRWSMMAREQNFANVNDLFAIAMSAARTANTTVAERARQVLAARAQAEEEGDLRPAIAIMEREVAALIDLANGRRDEAVKVLRAAADAELKLPAPLGLPAPIKPAPELLGEVLLEIGRPQEAIEPFEQALRRNANRSLSVLGAARAAAAVGDVETAKRRYAELLANYDEADADAAEVKEARDAIGRAAGDAPLMPSRDIGSRYVYAAIAGAAVVFLIAAMRRRTKKSGAATRRPRHGKSRIPNPESRRQG
jgi:tetratricopeptide (TPR) repeat protein